ncbi:MAG TPA: 30S ribosomal protein S9 [Elusimicrobiales bacterium]|nr:30S ribosomal protein S9 [Elusimicrobiales bacterium]
MEENIKNKQTGRRKTSVATVKITDGSGRVTVNSKPADDFFKGCDRFKHMALSAINAIEGSIKHDFAIKVKGSGPSSQAGAIRHATARTLANFSLENRKILKKKGFLTRDSREVERKKYGLKGARGKFQFSKR